MDSKKGSEPEPYMVLARFQTPQPTFSATGEPMPMIADSPTRTITLFCWILDESDSPFSIDIEDSKTVDHLKDAIVKKKPVTFANVEADQLKLWKVSDLSPL
jgi:hypothetical protein